MRSQLLLIALLPLSACACTTFKVTQAGRTLIGCNEDAWSTNAQVRFEQGRDGHYGAIYFGHFNGSPLRAMVDQMGMNEMGLVFDGLGIQPRQVPPVPGLRQLTFDALMPLVLRTCKDVREAAALLRTYDRSLIPHAMIFLADRQGGYLIVENDTLIEGHDPWFAVGNWRMSTCTDPSAIPIPRLQAGRALLAEGIDGSVASATRVLERMKACRKKLGNGTLFSAIFDPELGQAHLFFYHVFSERVTFDLKRDLARGDRTIDMASLFGPRPEYAALRAYRTPFHQRWLFWGLLGLAAAAASIGLVSALTLLRRMWRRMRGLAAGPWMAPVVAGAICAVIMVLVPVLLLNEGVYYFGLADAMAALACVPLLLLALLLAYGVLARRYATFDRRTWMLLSALCVPLLAGLAYWGMVWP